MSKTYSTRKAAALAGIHRITLQRWLAAGVIKPSQSLPLDGGKTLWRFSDADVAKLRKLKATRKRGPKSKQ